MCNNYLIKSYFRRLHFLLLKIVHWFGNLAWYSGNLVRFWWTEAKSESFILKIHNINASLTAIDLNFYPRTSGDTSFCMISSNNADFFTDEVTFRHVSRLKIDREKYRLRSRIIGSVLRISPLERCNRSFLTKR